MTSTLPLTSLLVLRTDTSTPISLKVREDRLIGFYDFCLRNRQPNLPDIDWNQGIRALAALGLTAIFLQIPSRFPAKDLLNALRAYQPNFLGSEPKPPLSEGEIENSLALYGKEMPQLFADGSENV